MNLTGIRKVGRYRHNVTGKEYNVHKGERPGYGTTHRFYYRSGKKVMITELEFWADHTKVKE